MNHIEAMKQALEFLRSGNFVYPTKIATDLEQAIAEAEKQEPIIDKSAAIRIATALGWEPKREWVGLTDEEQQELYDTWIQRNDGWGSFYDLIEAKLKEKNT